MQRIFILFSLLLLTLLFLVGFNEKTTLEELIIKSPKSSSYIKLSCVNEPSITFYDADGKSRLEIVTGKETTLTFKDKKGNPISQLSDKKLAFPKLFLEGSPNPGIYLSNNNKKVVGSWTVLNDGGSGIGFANSDGEAASIIRGGKNPTVAFFNKEATTPVSAFGLSNNVPSLFINGQKNEGVLIHGGQPTGLMCMDEKGSVKILISKEGLFQEQKEAPLNFDKKSSDNKLFTFDEDNKLLFFNR